MKRMFSLLTIGPLVASLVAGDAIAWVPAPPAKEMQKGGGGHSGGGGGRSSGGGGRSSGGGGGRSSGGNRATGGRSGGSSGNRATGSRSGGNRSSGSRSSSGPRTPSSRSSGSGNRAGGSRSSGGGPRVPSGRSGGSGNRSTGGGSGSSGSRASGSRSGGGGPKVPSSRSGGSGNRASGNRSGGGSSGVTGRSGGGSGNRVSAGGPRVPTNRSGSNGPRAPGSSGGGNRVTSGPRVPNNRVTTNRNGSGVAGRNQARQNRERQNTRDQRHSQLVNRLSPAAGSKANQRYNNARNQQANNRLSKNNLGKHDPGKQKPAKPARPGGKPNGVDPRQRQNAGRLPAPFDKKIHDFKPFNHNDIRLARGLIAGGTLGLGLADLLGAAIGCNDALAVCDGFDACVDSFGGDCYAAWPVMDAGGDDGYYLAPPPDWGGSWTRFRCPQSVDPGYPCIWAPDPPSGDGSGDCGAVLCVAPETVQGDDLGDDAGDPEVLDESPGSIWQTTRFLRVSNTTDKPMRIFVAYHAPTDDGDWVWSEEPVAYDFGPGEEADLADNGWQINADRVKIWAESDSKEWKRWKDQPLWLVPESSDPGNHGYLAPNIQTFVFNVR